MWSSWLSLYIYTHTHTHLCSSLDAGNLGRARPWVKRLHSVAEADTDVAAGWMLYTDRLPTAGQHILPWRRIRVAHLGDCHISHAIPQNVLFITLHKLMPTEVFLRSNPLNWYPLLISWGDNFFPFPREGLKKIKNSLDTGSKGHDIVWGTGCKPMPGFHVRTPPHLTDEESKVPKSEVA